jgi:hypothetical protein
MEICDWVRVEPENTTVRVAMRWQRISATTLPSMPNPADDQFGGVQRKLVGKQGGEDTTAIRKDATAIRSATSGPDRYPKP